jgi:hypothetical protein
MLWSTLYYYYLFFIMTTTTTNTNGIYTLNTDIGSLAQGTQLYPSLNGDKLITEKAIGLAFPFDSSFVTFTPTRDVVVLPQCDEALEKLVDAVNKQFKNEEFAYGEKYLFFQISDKTWRKATMEKTSSDFGRIVSGFALKVDASPKQKFNRLNNLNQAYGLGLSIEDIRDARDGVNA